MIFKPVVDVDYLTEFFIQRHPKLKGFEDTIAMAVKICLDQNQRGFRSKADFVNKISTAIETIIDEELRHCLDTLVIEKKAKVMFDTDGEETYVAVRTPDEEKQDVLERVRRWISKRLRVG